MGYFKSESESFVEVLKKYIYIAQFCGKGAGELVLVKLLSGELCKNAIISSILVYHRFCLFLLLLVRYLVSNLYFWLPSTWHKILYN